MTYLLAIDQGTTNSRAILFNREGVLIQHAEIALKSSFPHDGWVEQDPLAYYQNTVACCQTVVKNAGIDVKAIAALGITNQRETTIVWDQMTGLPIYPAIVWQDRRTSEYCKELARLPLFQNIAEKTGLLLDPYFSASKLVWILDNVPNARQRAAQGELLFGTVDSFLLWKLTGGKRHLTDITNASRTLLFNIHTLSWDEDILNALNIPSNILPKVCDNTAQFGELDKTILGVSIPITGMAGDQQAATIGQACFKKGMLKVTYGTGCFLLLNTGDKVVASKNKLLSTVAYRINQKIAYGLEGSIFAAGSTIKWLRDKLQLVSTAAESADCAQQLKDNGGVYLVPAFTGLGAPYWAPDARAAIFGMTSNTNKAHIVRAALESVAYQTRDLLKAIENDLENSSRMQDKVSLLSLRVDGGMSVNNWLLQFLANMLNLPIERPKCIETTALGAAYLAGLQIGVYQTLEEIESQWQVSDRFQPDMNEKEREKLYAGWLIAVNAVISYSGVV